MKITTKFLLVSISILLAASLSACKSITLNNDDTDKAAAYDC